MASALRGCAPRTHPATVDTNVLRSLLQSVHYRQSTVFAFVLGNPRPVFTPYQLSLLSEYLPRAFEQALPQEVIYFRLRDEPDGLRRTIGWCFLIDSELHLVFEEIRQPMVQPKELAPQPIAKRWELVPQPGQRRFVSRSKGAPEPNWFILPLPDSPPLSRAIPRSGSVPHRFQPFLPMVMARPVRSS